MKKVFATVLSVCMAAALFAGCGASTSSSTAASSAASGSAVAEGELDPNIKATLTFATWDNEAIDFYEELDLEGRFQELYPNVDLEI